MSEPKLDLKDIQGNILLGYGLPFSKYLFFEITDGLAARKSLAELIREVTNSEWWRDEKLEETFNVAFSFSGLRKLDLPAESLAGFPVEFQQGMLQRSTMLNNVRKNSPENWEAFWRNDEVDLWMSINAISAECRARKYERITQVLRGNGGLKLLQEQDGNALVIDGATTTKEHFGYTDGIGNPDIEGTGIPPRPGRGEPQPAGKWKPVRTGEFLLGYLDEGGAVASAPEPHMLARNGSFLVYLKLHQNVAAFREYLDKAGRAYPGGKDLLKAKLVGRWDDGTPLELCPFHKDPALAQDPMRNNDFGYEDDPEGTRVPMGAHIRRMNPRDGFGFEGHLARRHRIARRGLPYGDWVPYEQEADDTKERGINFMVVNASIRRQFEFIWKQWVNYGNDFGLGNDRDPLIGNHTGHGSMVVPGDPDCPEKQPAYVLADIPQFVELRGGGYFFIPSLTALTLIVEGRVIEYLSTYDPAEVDQPIVVPSSAPQPIADGDSEIEDNESFWKWLIGLPSTLLSIPMKWIKSWAAAHPLTVFWLLRTFKPVFIRDNVAVISRYRDVLQVLNAKDVFFVTYGEKMERLTDGGEFFLGMQPSPKYDQDVSNLRSATRREDIHQIIIPTVESTARNVIDSAGGTLNVATELGLIVPTALTGKYLGISTQDAMTFARQASVMFRYLFIPDNPVEVESEALQIAVQFREHIDAIIRERHHAKVAEDDMMARCLQMEKKDVPRLDDVQIRNNLMGLLIGMIPTTAKCAAQVLDQLLSRPQELHEAQRAARSNNDELLAKYVFEALRFNPQNLGLLRVVASDCRVGGKQLRKGTNVLALTWSAMFDGREILAPNEFRIDRPATDYLHFGAGMHECFGKQISHIQIPRMLKPLLQKNRLRRAEGDAGRLQMSGPFPSSLVVEYDSRAAIPPI